MSGRIYTKLMGGLGNQLFQYAYALKLQKLFPDKQIVLDTRYFRKKHIRSLELKDMSVRKVTWTDKAMPLYDMTYLAYAGTVRLVRNSGGRVTSAPALERFGLLYNNIDSVYRLPHKRFGNIYLGGYYQNEKEIRCVKDEIAAVIRPRKMSDKACSYLNSIADCRTVGISIRIGEDYKRFGWDICSRAYYENGARLILSDGTARQLFVFSDDIERIKREGWFGGFSEKVTFVGGCSASESLYLLSRCDDFVIANSTFSWWGAYLGESIGKQIAAPEYFFSGRLMKNGGLHIPNAVYLDMNTGRPLTRNKPIKTAAVTVLYEPNERELEAVREKSALFDRVIIYDNSQTSHSSAFSGISNAEYLFNARNDGLAKAYNTALDFCGRENIDRLFILDQDSGFDNDSIRSLLRVLPKMPDDCAVVCPFISYNDSDVPPSKTAEQVNWTINSGSVLNVPLLHKKDIRYDESYFLDRLDRDFCMQITRSGLKIIRYNKAVMHQRLGSADGSRNLHSPLRNYYMARNRLYYNRKFFPLPKRLFLNTAQTARHIFGIIYDRNNACEKLKMTALGIGGYFRHKTGRYSG